MPTVGSLFAGIGGIDLGLERAGWTSRWQVELDPFCCRVLSKHWPAVPRYGDIRTVDWSTVEPVDLLAGGFPCQPVSSAGRQAAQADARWLWPEFARAIRDLRPRLVLVENVTNLLAVNGGSAFGDVLGDLAAIGYDAEWDCVPASAVGALHERDRVWLVAYPARVQSGRTEQWAERQRTRAGGQSVAVPDPDRQRRESERSGGPRRGDSAVARDDGTTGTLADADRDGLPLQRFDVSDHGNAFTGYHPDRRGSAPPMADAAGSRLQGSTGTGAYGPGRTSEFVAAGGSPLPDAERGGRDGRTPDAEWKPGRRAPAFQAGTDPRWSDHWQLEPDVGRVAHGVPSRVDRLRSLGNAVVPQVVEHIARTHPRFLEMSAA